MIATQSPRIFQQTPLNGLPRQFAAGVATILPPQVLPALILPALLLLALLPTAAVAQDAAPKNPGDSKAAAPAKPLVVNLRPTFKVGRNSRFETWSRQQRNVTTFVNGQQRAQVNSSTVFTSGVKWTVDSVTAEGGATCTMTIEWIRMESTQGDNDPNVVDTREGGDNAALPFLKAITGTPLRCEMRADGSVVSVTGGDDIKNKLGEDDAEFAPDELDWKEMASEIATLPGGPAKAGANANWTTNNAWNHSVMSRNVGKTTYNAKHELKGVETIAGIPVANITTTATGKLTPDLSALPNGGQGLEVTLTESSFTEQVMYDLQRHEVVGRNSVGRETTRLSRAAGDISVTQVISEAVQGQTLRVAEEGD